MVHKPCTPTKLSPFIRRACLRSFTTHTGTVSAADDWDTPVQCKQVRHWCGASPGAVHPLRWLHTQNLTQLHTFLPLNELICLPHDFLPLNPPAAPCPQVRKSMPGSYEHLFHK